MRKTIRKFCLAVFTLMFVFGAFPLATLQSYAKTISVDSEQSLVDAVNAGGDIKLSDNIRLSSELNIPEGVTVILNLNGKTLDRDLKNCVDHGGVIRVNPGASLTVTDSSGNNLGTITGGASWNGGGICNHGTLIFEGGTIEKCKANHSSYGGGGAIFNSGFNGSKPTLYLRGGLIRNNEARNGGGIYNGPTGTLVIEKKVTVKSKKETVTNVVVTGNSASNDGGGIFSSGAFNMGGSPTINSNKSNDIFLSEGKKILITDELGATSKMIVKATGTNRVITQDYSKYNSANPVSLFSCYNTKSVVMLSAAENGEVIFKNDSKTIISVYDKGKLTKREETDSDNFVSVWNTAIGYAKNNTNTSGETADDSVVEITLGRDFSHDTNIYINAYRNIILDLNGHYIKRGFKKQKSGYLFKVGEYAKFTVKDSDPGSDGYAGLKGGVIGEGNGDDCGGGVIVQKRAQFYMLGGTIYNCKTDYHGGGVYLGEDYATLVMKDCAIVSCLTKDSGDDCHGAGIYVKDAKKVILENVTINKCQSEDKGGGLYLREKPRYVRLKNVTFSNGYADDGGGAIFIDDLKSDTEFSFEADNCTFIKNRGAENGGAVNVSDDDESTAHNPVVFRNCTFKDNTCTKYAGALEVNDNGVVIIGGTFTGNKADGKGGAVYVEGEYDISLGGKLIIKGNDGKDNYDNLTLEENSNHKAYIYNAGLYEGSEIYIGTSNNKSGINLVNSIGRYQADYFHADNGSLSFVKTGTAEAQLVTASVFGEGSKFILIAIAAVAVTAACVSVLVYKKRKGAVADNDDNDEE